MAYHQDIGEWQGKELVDRNGARIGKLEDVYVDVETNEPVFGSVKEGLISRHLTFVPLAGITIGPDNLQVAVSKDQVKSAPNIELHGDELSRADESALYHHYQLNYTPPDTERGRQLARPDTVARRGGDGASHATSRSSWASASAPSLLSDRVSI